MRYQSFKNVKINGRTGMVIINEEEEIEELDKDYPPEEDEV